MEILQDGGGIIRTYVSCYFLLIGSALIPWLNSELIVVSLSALMPSDAQRVVLVLVAAAGQVSGNSVLYWAGRGAFRLPRAERTLATWREKLKDRKLGGMAVLLSSATLGLPPFFPLSLLAGSLGVPFARFVVVGTCGRALRYGAVAFASSLVLPLFR